MFFALWMELMFMIYGTVLAQKQMTIFHQKIWHYCLAVFFCFKSLMFEAARLLCPKFWYKK